MDIKDYKRVIAIGDIHGQYNALEKLWKKIKFKDNEDFVIFLGDYIDRGGDSIECLQFVKNLVENNHTVVALKGNHEDFMSKYCSRYPIQDERINDIWLDPCNGGDVTINQLRKLSENKCAELIKFVDNLPVYYDKFDGHFFVHAGINPQNDLYNQKYEDYMWIREEFLDVYEGDLQFVVGHTPVQYYDYGLNSPIMLENNIIMMDTGAAMNKRISAMDISTRTLYQAECEDKDEY